MELEIFDNISEVIDEFEKKEDIYKLIAEEVKTFFEKDVFTESNYELSMIYRIKSPESIREKLIRNNYELQKGNPEKTLASMRDIIGLRIECKFIDEEKYAYQLLKELFTRTDDDVYYYMFSMPRLKLKLSDRQPQKQKNGFEIYKIDGYYQMGRDKVNFELQIKALVNSFWSEIEHRVVYKNRNFLLNDSFVSDLFNSIKKSLNTLDNQLYLLYNRFHGETDYEQDRTAKDKKKEHEIETFITSLVFATFDDLIMKELEFSVDFKSSCDAIVRYIMNKEEFNEMSDYGRIIQHFFDALDNVEDDWKLISQIKLDRECHFAPGFEEKIGNAIIENLNTNFRWHLFFSILFAMEKKSEKEQVIEEFVRACMSEMTGNRTVISFRSRGFRECDLILDEMMDAVADVICGSGKIEYFCVKGITTIHQAMNYMLPIVENELSRGDSWADIKHRYWNIFIKMIEL
ncbi:MAG: hypothetical protein IJK00_04405 [Clostridia bacterium]|nr:hypothetical protein [Clostridia bacterium]